MVQVELKNQGGDAFKHEIYGDSIIIERRITETSSPTALKDSQGLFEMLVIVCLRFVHVLICLFK